MGAQQGDPDALPREQPRHRVKVDGFFMDRHEVTNVQYAEFVRSTGYMTVAERPVDTPQGSYDPGSMTFFSPEAIFSLRVRKRRDEGAWANCLQHCVVFQYRFEGSRKETNC